LIDSVDAQNISRRLGRISSLLSYVGAGALFVMMCLTTTDVVGRYIFNKPILGAFELTQFLVLILIFSFLAYTQAANSHVAVDLLVTHLPKRMQRFVEFFNHGVCLGLMALITYMAIIKAVELIESGDATVNLRIPIYPSVFFLVLGCAVMCIEYVRDLMRLFGERKGGSSS
jgi:TRAP-type C4-dicarboxylate transport system permease small subunit